MRTALEVLLVTAVVAIGAVGCATDTGRPPGTPPPTQRATSPEPVATAPADPLPGMPTDFVRLRDRLPDAVYEMRYAGPHNFTGSRVTGYSAGECWVTHEAAEALARAQQRVARRGYSLKFYDCFRPQRAVDAFVAWAADDSTVTKQEFYPTLGKADLFPQGYIAAKSGHSRGSTVDVTLVPEGEGASPGWQPGEPQVRCTAPASRRFPDTSIDMGTGFDCFNPLANTADPRISATAQRNRAILVSAMRGAGFTNLPQEWWHYTLTDEPYSDTYFDAEITR